VHHYIPVIGEINPLVQDSPLLAPNQLIHITFFNTPQFQLSGKGDVRAEGAHRNAKYSHTSLIWEFTKSNSCTNVPLITKQK
jgi:hypothetical protein